MENEKGKSEKKERTMEKRDKAQETKVNELGSRGRRESTADKGNESNEMG